MAQVIEIVLMLVFGAGALVSAATSIIGLSINGIMYALILLGALIATIVYAGFRRIGEIQTDILEEAEEQSQLLRLIAKQGRTRNE